jgi:phosphatidylinositol-3-phosphatase
MAVVSRFAAALFLSLALVAGATAAPRPVPRLSRIVLVVFENKERSQIAGNPDAPTFAALARRYASLSHYDAVSHPSLPNYLALLSGSTDGIQNDCTKCVVHARSLADTLAHAGRRWKVYAEDLSSIGFTGAFSGEYTKKHDPFAYFASVLAHPSWRRRLVPLRQLRRDARRETLPDFSLIVPNLCHDMHNCSIKTGDAWLRANIVPLLSSPALKDGAVFVTFDEGMSDVGGGGNVETLVLGPLARHGVVDRSPASHYSLLRTIEDAWHLPLLGRSASAAPITGVWRR